MGYNLSLGEAEPVLHFEDRYARMGVKFEVDPEAPPNSESGDPSNTISAGYLAWANFAADTGLYSLFYAPRCPGHRDSAARSCTVCEGGRKSVWWVPEGKDPGQGREGLIGDGRSAGAAALTSEHLAAFRAAREAWLARPDEERRAKGVGEDGVDYVLRRLDWLVFWTGWALKNCKYPSFAHS